MTSPCTARAACFAALLAFTAPFAFAQSPTPAKKPDANALGIVQKDRPKGAKTEITAQTGSTYDDKVGIATFEGKVVVKDPQFNLFTDKLTVYLRKDRKGIERAEADGNVVIVQDNVNEKGDVQKSVGRAGRAVFVPETGDITMTIMPSLQQGINNHIATDEKTVMILNRAGKLNTIGGSRTVLTDAAEGGRP